MNHEDVHFLNFSAILIWRVHTRENLTQVRLVSNNSIMNLNRSRIFKSKISIAADFPVAKYGARNPPGTFELGEQTPGSIF